MPICVYNSNTVKYRGVEQLVARRAHNLASDSFPVQFWIPRKTKYRGVEQLVARRAHNPEAGGSSPPPATKNKPKILYFQGFSAFLFPLMFFLILD